MKPNRIIYLSILFAALMAGSSIVHAQCTNYPPITVNCQGVNCSGKYSMPPPAGGSIYDDSGVELRCCGHVVTVFNGGGGCQPAAVKAAGARQSLEYLASIGNQVMVKSCQGKLVVYKPLVLTFDPHFNVIKFIFNDKPAA